MIKKDFIKTLFSLAKLDEKCRVNSTRALFFLIMLSFFFFLTINSFVSSIVENLESIIYKPYGRVVNIIAGTDTYEEKMEQYQKLFSEEPGIGQIFWHTSVLAVIWNNSDILGVQSQDIMVTSKIEAIDKYLSDGSAELEKGEILIPKYLFGMGKYNEYTFADGKELVGKDILLTVKNSYTEESKEYTFRVAGTFNNLKASTGNNIFCLNEGDALELYEYINCYNEDIWINEILKGLGQEDDKETYESLRKNHYIGFYINEGYSISEVSEKIEQISQEICFPFFQRDNTLIEFYKFIIYLSNIIVVILGAAALIILLVSVMRDLKSRYGQIAMRYACGYRISFQLLSFLTEKIGILLKAAAAAAGLTVILLLAGNYIIQNIMPFYQRNIVLSMNWKALLCMIFGMLAGAMLCIVFSLRGMLKLNITATLKKEGR